MKLGYKIIKEKERKLYLYFLFQKVKILKKKRKIMLVTMATPISSHVEDKNSIYTARDEDMIFLVKGKILVFHQYLYNKDHYITT